MGLIVTVLISNHGKEQIFIIYNNFFYLNFTNLPSVGKMNDTQVRWINRHACVYRFIVPFPSI